MEAPDLITADFWSSEANHIALPPFGSENAEGLSAFAQQMGARGWCFFQTSGSEGQPKWVGLEKSSFLVSARAVNAHFHVTENDRWLIAIPLHHVGGFSILARCHVSGAPAHELPGPWDSAAFVEACIRQRITLTSLVPTQLHDLVRQHLAAPPTLRITLIGGGALSPALRREAEHLGWPVRTTFGMTEAASQIATESTADELIVLPHWQLSTDATDTLTIRGPALAKGYASLDPKRIWHWHPIDPDIGLRTRDRVRLASSDSHQTLRFLGRESDSLKICGELVSRDALQSRIDTIAFGQNFPAPVLLVPLPDPRRETSLTLVTQSHSSTPAQQTALLESFNATALPHERAFQIRTLPALPCTPIGKPDLPATQRLLQDS
jgi:O-succinylbenzoic acid--CoA ligase